MNVERPEFEKLALEQLDLLYRVARRLTRTADEAADLVQETFLRALKGFHTFNLESHGIRPWLVRVMQNLHFSRFSREKGQPISLDALPLDVTQGRPEPEVAAFEGREGMDERLAAALEELPPDYQTVLLLWAVEEFSYKEIADSLDIPIGTVMSRLHRARQKLSEALRAFATDERLIRE
jgi:RNA polymerase sigma-70 factor (ECF subfamily)